MSVSLDAQVASLCHEYWKRAQNLIWMNHRCSFGEQRTSLRVFRRKNSARTTVTHYYWNEYFIFSSHFEHENNPTSRIPLNFQNVLSCNEFQCNKNLSKISQKWKYDHVNYQMEDDSYLALQLGIWDKDRSSLPMICSSIHNRIRQKVNVPRSDLVLRSDWDLHCD